MPGPDRLQIARWSFIALALVIGAAAVAVRFWWALRITPRPISDAASYWQIATSLANGHGYLDDGVATAYRPIGYSAALAPALDIFGSDLAVARTFNAAISVFSLGSIYALTRAVSGSRLAALVALSLFGFYPADVGYTSLVLSELLFNALTLTAVCLVVFRPGSIGAHAMAGLLLGFATLTRPHAALILPCLAVGLFRRGQSKLQASRLVCVLGLACAATMVPWWVRNASVFGAFVPVSTNGGVNLYIGNHPEATGEYTFDKQRTARIDARLAPELQGAARELAFDRAAAGLALEYMRAEPARTAELWKLKLDSLFMHEGAFIRFSRKLPDEQRPLLQRLDSVSLRYYLSFLLLSAAGFALALFQLVFSRPARARSLWLPAAIVAAFTALTLLTFGDSRFHHPMMPWLAIYAGNAFGWLEHLASTLTTRTLSLRAQRA